MSPYGSSGENSPGRALSPRSSASRKVTVPEVRARKGAEPLVMLTAYDAPSARAVDEAGVDLILVGDSLGMVVLGEEDTLNVGLDDMVRHTAAVARTRPRALVVADMPFMSYHTGTRDAVLAAGRFVREARAEAVKLEGGARRRDVVRAIVDAEIPVMGHIGLTPQSRHQMGGFKVQGRDVEAIDRLVDDAHELVEAGIFALVLEGVPGEVARMLTAAVPVPTIGIGAGEGCDGQVLVFHDVLGLSAGPAPRFVRRYANLHAEAVDALSRFAADVRARSFPAPEESYRLPRSAAEKLAARAASRSAERAAGR